MYAVRPSTDFPDLPQPSADMNVLQRDFLQFGYCLVKDAMSEAEVAEATERLLDQAEAERAAKVAQVTPGGANTRTPDALHGGTGGRQLVSNLPSKGAVWRKIATNETHNGDLVGKLMESVLGAILRPFSGDFTAR